MRELDSKHRQMASTTSGGQTPPEVGGHSLGCGGEYGIRGGAGFAEVSRETVQPDRATRFIETSQGTLSYLELAPLLAERVARMEAEIHRGAFDDAEISEHLVSELHAGICGDLVPDWAGRWRNVEVRVGNLHPPLPHLVPLQMRDYALDLKERWQEASVEISERTIEFLAFAEGRFLNIHPFRDFNGRTIRLFITELLRRLDLPRVVLAPLEEQARSRYFSALESSDRFCLEPLKDIWRTRLEEASV
jgi:CRISPR-associated endonuclease/helicase Cas3